MKTDYEKNTTIQDWRDYNIMDYLTFKESKLNKVLTIVLFGMIVVFVFQNLHINPCEIHAHKADIDYVRFLEKELGEELIQEKLSDGKLTPTPKDIEDYVFWECISLKPLSDISVRFSESVTIEDDKI